MTHVMKFDFWCLRCQMLKKLISTLRMVGDTNTIGRASQI